MKRFADWPSRLAEVIKRHRNTPFEWGRHDCATFAAEAVLEVTGDSVLGSLQWSDIRTAAVALKGGGGLEAMVDARLPRRESTAYAQRGDIVLVKGASKRPWLAVCDADRCWAPGEHGLVSTPLASAVIAWRV